MCEATRPIEELRRLKSAMMSLPAMFEKGSDARDNLSLALAGVSARLEWVIANLEMAHEGNSNFGLQMYQRPPEITVVAKTGGAA